MSARGKIVQSVSVTMSRSSTVIEEFGRPDKESSAAMPPRACGAGWNFGRAESDTAPRQSTARTSDGRMKNFILFIKTLGTKEQLSQAQTLSSHFCPSDSHFGP